jgi:uncharacterized protein YmfQ (DUF2313 family)
MGITEQYEAAIKKLFPEGDYWNAQFADSDSDVSLFCRAKLPELVRFRQRVDALQAESVIEKTDELIADWERVLLDTVNHGLDINRRRLLLKSKRDVKLNREELQKIAVMFGLSIGDVVFPYRPAFFGFSRFNTAHIGSPVTFSVLRVTALQDGFRAKSWALIRPEFKVCVFGKARFGINRLAHFPAYKLRLFLNKELRAASVGFLKLGVGRLFPSPSYKVRPIVESRMRVAAFGFARAGNDRLVYSPIPLFRKITAGRVRAASFGFARAGNDRLVYTTVYAIKNALYKKLRGRATGLARCGHDRLFPIPLDTVRKIVNEKLRAFCFGALRFGTSRMARYKNGFSGSLISGAAWLFTDFIGNIIASGRFISRSDAAMINKIIADSGVLPSYDVSFVKTLIKENGVMGRFDIYFMRGLLSKTKFLSRFERVLIDYTLSVKQLFSDFEQAIKDKLLVNQIPYFYYEGD